ncbi:MAG: DUF2339 domain-containing protein [Bacteroidetes bacterium]|nr:MAG: DUF2339 domain-containing protein [Bacteroidota bacterium]
MENQSERINQLLEQIEELVKKQNTFSQEIFKLKSEVIRLKQQEAESKEEKQPTSDAKSPQVQIAPKKEKPSRLITKRHAEPRTSEGFFKKTAKFLEEDLELEKFIGENLINKIGIIVTIIGVAIGTKYAIDNDLITPVMRIILGYAAGLILLGIGIRLRKKYTNYSAVLVSGAMAILYFITYFAYGFYALYPQPFAFGLMVAITVLTVGAAIHYDKQIIAHIGLVGAYAVPYILGGDPDQILALFTYVAIINLGILFIAFRKDWKPLYYFAFLLTWMIYATWYFPAFEVEKHFNLGLVFSGIFFAIFYLTFLVYKLIQKEQFSFLDVIMLIGNSFIFYGFGYDILQGHEQGVNLLGVFTLGNAVVHFLVSLVIYRMELGDRKLFYLVTSLVLAFLTIAIPVELDGHWVTLIWTVMAALLFWVGRIKNFSIYEFLSYGLMILAFISLMHDWVSVYEPSNYMSDGAMLKPVFNVYFLTSIIFVGAFGFINYIHQDNRFTVPITDKNGLLSLIAIVLPALLIFVTYSAILLEILAYYEQLFVASKISFTADSGLTQYHQNEDFNHFKTVWGINYSLLFVSILVLLKIRRWKDSNLGQVSTLMSYLAIFIFLGGSLYALSELRESYLDQYLAEYFERGTWNIWIRYVSFIFIGILLWVGHINARQEFLKYDYSKFYNLLMHLAFVWILSSEVIHWMDMADAPGTYKLGLSILWGVYALFLIVMGIWKKQTYLRVSAMILFGVTLIKLFFYDVEHLETIPKTIVFVSLGGLLLVISFLYNKYKDDIFGERTKM